MYLASAKSRKIPGFHFQKSRDFHQPQIPGSRDSRDPAKACPPPLVKKSEYFLIRIFWIGRDPPPLLTQSKKKQFFYGSPNYTNNTN